MKISAVLSQIINKLNLKQATFFWRLVMRCLVICLCLKFL